MQIFENLSHKILSYVIASFEKTFCYYSVRISTKKYQICLNEESQRPQDMHTFPIVYTLQQLFSVIYDFILCHCRYFLVRTSQSSVINLY